MSSNTGDNEIKIIAKANKNGFFLMFVSTILFFITLFISHHYWFEWRLPLITLLLISGIGFVTGLVKKLQPPFSLIISKSGISYHHSSGKWCIGWQDIQYIGRVTSTIGIDRKELPYIGIRLSSMAQLPHQVSPRLANKLIHEQKALLIWAIQEGMITVEESIINFSPYKLASKDKQIRKIKGPHGLFLHQVDVLMKSFGYHLYIPSVALDRDINDFNQLLKACQQYIKHTANKSSPQ